MSVHQARAKSDRTTAPVVGVGALLTGILLLDEALRLMRP